MVLLEIGVGNDHVHKQWVLVVPNRYLDAELLLGTDILREARFVWNGKVNIIVWGNASYAVGHIRRQKGKRIHSIPPPLTHHQSGDITKRINLTKPIHVEPYQSQFVPVQVKENPNTTLLVHP